MQIKLSSSTFYKEEETKKALCEFIMKADKLSMGEEVAKFEKAFAKKQGREYAVMVSNGSMANLVLIQSLMNMGKLEKGDRVGISALTWATNVMPLIQLGLKPVAIDISGSLNISPESLHPHLGKIDALFITNLLGFCDDLYEIRSKCRDFNVLLIEDNCESLGSIYNGLELGNFGKAATFSFFVGHHLSTIEGGMIVTDDQDLYRMLVMVRAHGWKRDLLNSNLEEFYDKYTFYELAYNARPTEIQGFLGNRQLKYWDEICEKRFRNFLNFKEKIQRNDEMYSISTRQMDLVSNMAVPIICKDFESFYKYRVRFEHAGVEIRPIVAGNITQQPFYKKYAKVYECPYANHVHDYGFYFPNRPDLTEEEIKFLCKLLEP